MMSDAVKKLLPKLDALSLEDKALVAQRLIDSIEEEDEDALFVAELNRRMDDYLSGKDKGIPAEEVHRQLREKYG